MFCPGSMHGLMNQPVILTARVGFTGHRQPCDPNTKPKGSSQPVVPAASIASLDGPVLENRMNRWGSA